MAPEQAHENTSSPATDIWGLGATLFFAVHGEPAFDKGQAIPTLTAVLSDEPEVLAKAGALGPVIQAFLEKDPAARPDAEEAQAMLRQVADGHATSPTSAATAVAAVPVPTAVETMPASPAVESTAVERPAAAKPRERAAYVPDESKGKGLLIGLGVAAIIGLIAVLFFFGGDDEDPATQAGDDKKTSAKDNSNQEQPAGGGGDDVPPEEEPPADDSGLSTYTDPVAGYTVGVPDGWSTERASETATDFVAPSGAYLRVAYRTPPGEDVLGTLQAITNDRFATQYEDYEEISIESVEFRDYDAAQAEYTYQGQHAINLQFVTGDYGFALNFQASEEEWEELLPTFEAIKESFQPPG
jgi:hypothetical protein